MPTTSGGGGGKPPASKPPAKRKTGGGGDEPKRAPVTEPKAETHSKTRKGLVTDPDFEFAPLSLVGSWFHRLENGEIIWQGVVVAQIQPVVYLVQIDRQEPLVENVQRLITVEEMVTDDEGYEWRFFDSEEQARNAYYRWELGNKKEAT